MKISKRASIVQPSATLSITSKAKQMKADGLDVVSLGAGEPDFDTPDFIKKAAIEAINAGQTKYTPTSGTPALKKAICAKLKRENGLDYDPAQIVVSCGAKHSLYNAIQVLCDEGDELIIPSPYWVSYTEMANLAGATPVLIDTNDESAFKITAAQLKAAITPKTRALILNSPSNPTGSVYSRAELEEIAKVVVEKDIFVISDEIYEHILYDDVEFVSIASLGDEIKKRTVLVNGMSKAYSMTGWRIGYLAAQKELASTITRVQDHSTSGPCSISQAAAVEAINNGLPACKEMVAEFKKRRDYIIGRVEGIKGLSAVKPNGAFYLFINIAETGYKSMDFAAKLLDEKMVAAVPGLPFGSDAHIRVSYATSMANLQKAFDRIEEFLA